MKLSFGDFTNRIIEAAENRLDNVRLYTEDGGNSLAFDNGMEDTIVFNISKVYDRYVETEDIESAIESVITSYLEDVEKVRMLSNISSFEKIKYNIFPCFINAEAGKQVLLDTDAVYMENLDYCIYYRIRIAEEITSVVNKAMMLQWGISVYEIDELAWKNAKKLYPVEVKAVNDAANDIAPQGAERIDNENGLLVATNQKLLLGATALWYPGMAKLLWERLGEDYYILPVSVHECLILSESNLHRPIVTYKEDLIKMSNGNKPEDKFSEHIFVCRGDEIVPVV